MADQLLDLIPDADEQQQPKVQPAFQPLALDRDTALDAIPDMMPARATALDNIRASRELGLQPDSVLAERDLARRTGLPEAVVREHKQTVEARAWTEAADSWLMDAPGTARFLADHRNAQVAHDDVQGLSDLERQYGTIRATTAEDTGFMERARWNLHEGVKDVVRNTVGQFRGLFEFFAQKDQEAMASLPPEVREKILAQRADVEGGALSGLAQVLPDDAAKVLTDTVKSEKLASDVPLPTSGVVQQYWSDVVRMSPQIGAQIAAALAGGVPLSMGFMSTQIMGAQANELLDKGVSPDRALAAGIFNTLVQAPLESLSIGRMTNLIKGGPVASPILEGVKTVVTEMFTEWAQKYPEAFSNIWAQADMNGQDFEGVVTQFADEFWEITKEGMYEGLVAAPFGGVMGSPAILNSYLDAKQAERVKGWRDQQVELHTAIQASQTMQRSPDTMKAFGDILGLGEEVWIDAEALAQRGPELMQRIGVDAETVAQAAQDGVSIKLNTSALMYEAEYPDLLQDLRPAPSAMSAREAESYDPVQALKDIEEASIDAETMVAEVVAVKDRMRQTLEARGLGETLDANWELASRLSRMLSPKGDPTAFVQKLNVMADVVERQADSQNEAGSALFQPRTKPAPQKTVKAYKLFRVDPRQPGKLFPLFVDANTPVEMGQWLDAEIGEMAKDGKKVKSKIGPLAFRPGWHAGDLPIATHIGLKANPNDSAPSFRNPDHVWAEIEMAADVDWQEEANRRARVTKAGTIDAKTAHITDRLPEDGFYRYKTNSNMTGSWLIGGSMKVNRILTDDEVQQINTAAGTADLPRSEPFDAGKFGFTLFQRADAPTEQAEDRKWAKHEPERTKGGKIKGAPEWVQNDKDLAKMRREMRKFVQEGLVGRFWYENSAQAVVDMVGGDVAQAEKFIQLLAIYSPNSNVWVNSIQAVRAYTHWARGASKDTFSVGSGDGDGKATSVLYDDVPWNGRKTNSFYLNLMYDIAQRYPDELARLNVDEEVITAITQPATIDVWMARAFGYAVEQFGNDKGSGQYSFAENEVRRLTARLNREREPGTPRWTPHQVQAAVWTAIKTRYEIQEVKDATNKRSQKQGLIYKALNDKGKEAWVYPKNAELRRKHLANWRHFAMQVKTEQVIAEAEINARSFGDDLQRMTNVVTWEANPSTAFGHDINNASPEVLRNFTAEARALLMDEEGNDTLAMMLGVPLTYSANGFGAYASAVSPNNLAHLLPARAKGQEGFSAEEVRAYARAIQYIFKQDAVPWFRPENEVLTSEAAKKDQQFKVINTKTGRLVPKGRFDTQAEAEAFAKTKGEGFEVRGGNLAKAVVLRYDRTLESADLERILGVIKEYLGDDAGFTRTADNEITLINFRDDQTKLPWVYDEAFIKAVDSFADDHGAALGLIENKSIRTEGEYGYVQDWSQDKDGRALLSEGSLGGRPDLHPWLRSRRDAFEALIERYSGDNLAREQEGVTLFQQAGSFPVRAGGPRVLRVSDVGPVRASYGEQKAGGSSVVGFHYSREPRETLSGDFYGTGIKGAEARRVALSSDPRLSKRIHFYVDTGQGIRPEPGVGNSIHAVKLNNLYDTDLDPLGLKAAAYADRMVDPNVAFNNLESAIIDAGFDGIYVPQAQSTKGVAVLLGDHTAVPVEQVQQSETLLQQSTGPRGAYNQLKDGSHLVRLFEQANASTMPHELAHAFLTELRAMAETGVADEAMLADLQKIEAWLDREAVEGSPEWQSYYEDSLAQGMNEAQARERATFILRHEKFSRGFEQYLWEGKAPEPELEGVFARFSRWLKQIYQDALAFGVNLDPEIRSVFDRMLKADAEVESKVMELGFTPMTQALAKHLGLGPEDRDYAVRLYSAALEKAEAKLAQARNKGLRRIRAEWKKEAIEAATNSPVHQMLTMLKKGRGIDRAEFLALYGDEAAKGLPRGVLREGGLSLNEAAFEHNYDTHEQMVNDLWNYRKPEDIAAEVVEARTAERDATFKVEDFVLETAEFAAYQELMAKAYDKNGNVLSNKAFRDYARKIVATMPLSDAMDVRGFLAAMARHHKAETKALKAGKLAEAAKANKKARLNHAYAQEALNVRKQVEKIERMAKRLTKLKAGKIEEGYHKALLQLIQRFGLTKKDYSGLQDVPALADLVKLQDAFGADEEASFSQWLLSGESRNYKDLTSGDFEELQDLMKFLYGTGKDLIQPTLKVSGLTMDEVKEKIVPQIEALPKRGKRRKEGTWLRKMQDQVQSYLSQNRTLLWVIRELDGYTALKGVVGPLEKWLYEPLEAANLKRAELSRQLEKRTRKARAQLLKSATAKANKVSLVDLPVPPAWQRQGRVWDFDACLSVLMNMGNAVNRQRVMDGYNLTEQDLQKILSVFSQKDATAVQDIWDAMDEILWPEIAGTHKKLRFYTPGKVQAEAFTMPDGTVLRGGYYPLKYDPSADTRAARNQDLDKAVQNPATAMLPKSVASGATKARAASAGGMPVLLRTSVLSGHLDWAVHYASHALVIHDLGRILGDKEIAEAIKTAAGEETFRAANELVKRIANPRAGDLPTFLDKVFGKLTGISAVYSMWMNRFGPLTQPTAIGNYIAAEGGWGKGTATWMKGAAHFMANPAKQWAWLMENNAALKNHFTLIRQQISGAIGEDFRDIQLGKTKSGRIWTASKETVIRGGIAMYGVMDAVVSVPGWYGSYLRGLDEGLSTEEATVRANKIMAEYTPMSRDMDKTLFQHTKGMARAWTYMMSYFTKQANTNAGFWKAWRQGAIGTDQFIGQIVAVQILPAVVVSMMYSLLTGDDDDRDNILMDAGLEVVAYPFAGLPFAREGAAWAANLARAGITGDTKKLGRNAFQMPGMMYLQLMQRAGSTTYAMVQDFDDDETQAKALMSMAELAAATAGMPPVPKVAKEVMRGLDDIDDDEGNILNVLIKPKIRKRD